MKVDNLVIDNSIRSIEGMNEMTADVKAALEQRINLKNYSKDERPIVLSQSVVMRMCLLAGLADHPVALLLGYEGCILVLVKERYGAAFHCYRHNANAYILWYHVE